MKCLFWKPFRNVFNKQAINGVMCKNRSFVFVAQTNRSTTLKKKLLDTRDNGRSGRSPNAGPKGAFSKWGAHNGDTGQQIWLGEGGL